MMIDGVLETIISNNKNERWSKHNKKHIRQKCIPKNKQLVLGFHGYNNLNSYTLPRLNYGE